MSTLATRTGSSYDMTTGFIAPAVLNNLSKSLDQGVLRVLCGILLDQGLITNSTAQLIVNETTKRFTIPTDTVAGVIGGIFFVMDDTMELDTTASSGSTTTAINAALTYVENYWKDAYIVFTSGTNNGLARQITAFDAETGKVTWTTPTTAAVANGDTFTLTFFYISGLTADAVNYVYAQLLARSPYDNVVKFTANTTGVTPSDGILLSTVTLNGAGAVTASNNNPTGADRTLYCNLGGYDTLTYSALVEAVPLESYSDVEVEHSFFLYRGGITVTVDDGDCSVIPIEYFKPDKTKIRITNPTGVAVDTTYTLTVSGRVRKYI